MRPDLGLTDAATAAKDPAWVWGPSGRISGLSAGLFPRILASKHIS